MRNCQRNQIRFWYRLYNRNASPVANTDVVSTTVTYETGEYTLSYLDPVACYGNISPAKGSAQIEYFGNEETYDKVIVTADMNCPIDEHSVLYIERIPIKDLTTDRWNKHDYVVTRVAKSINQIAIAIRKVDVS